MAEGESTIGGLNPLPIQLTDLLEGERADGSAFGRFSVQDIVNQVPPSTTAVWGQITGTLSNQTDLQSALNAKTNQTDFTAHTGDSGIHFTQASIDHTSIQNVGSNTHAQIDSHIADANIHYADAPADSQQYARINNGWQVVAGGGGGEANTADNLGAGEGVFAQKVGIELQFKSLVQGSNITLTSDANTITISAAGGGGATSLNDLTDVTLSGVSEGQVLRRGATDWNNSVLVIADVSGLQAALDGKADSGAENTAVWGSITGTLSGQADLQAALDAKADLAGDTFTGPMLFADGSVTNPSIAFGSETNTGLYRVSPGVVGLTVGGVLLATFSAANGIRSADDVQGFQTLP